MRIERVLLLVLPCLLIGCAQPKPASSPPVSAPKVPQRRPLDPARQAAFLSQRTSGGLMGNFDSYCSLLYAVSDVAIHTESEAVAHTTLNAPFPDFYKPTWRELFDTIARQTKSSWTYDGSRDFWVFGAPPQRLPFEITMAEGWKTHDEGLYVGYQPPIVPVGMDVYLLGAYSATNPAGETALFDRVREAIAVRFASGFKSDASGRDMKEVPVGKLSALHFETTAPSGILWRQWVIVDSGQAFAIVSAIKPEHEKEVLPDVLKMVASFKVVDAARRGGQAGAVTGRPGWHAAEPRAVPAGLSPVTRDDG